MSPLEYPWQAQQVLSVRFNNKACYVFRLTKTTRSPSRSRSSWSPPATPSSSSTTCSGSSSTTSPPKPPTAPRGMPGVGLHNFDTLWSSLAQHCQTAEQEKNPNTFPRLLQHTRKQTRLSSKICWKKVTFKTWTFQQTLIITTLFCFNKHSS